MRYLAYRYGSVSSRTILFVCTFTFLWVPLHDHRTNPLDSSREVKKSQNRGSHRDVDTDITLVVVLVPGVSMVTSLRGRYGPQDDSRRVYDGRHEKCSWDTVSLIIVGRKYKLLLHRLSSITRVPSSHLLSRSG